MTKKIFRTWQKSLCFNLNDLNMDNLSDDTLTYLTPKARPFYTHTTWWFASTNNQNQTGLRPNFNYHKNVAAHKILSPKRFFFPQDVRRNKLLKNLFHIFCTFILVFSGVTLQLQRGWKETWIKLWRSNQSRAKFRLYPDQITLIRIWSRILICRDEID